MPARSTLYEQVVYVTAEYLGPAAERFIARQITNHLRKKPEDLDSRDLQALIDWLKLSMAFLTSDEQLISRYVGELQTIVTDNRRRKEVRGHGRS